MFAVCNMVSTAIVKGLLVFALVGVTMGLKCEADHGCPDNHYCYGSVSRTCVLCVTCKYYKRAVSKPACAHSALDCGPCLPGFEEVLLTHGRRHYCIPTTALPETTTFLPHSNVSEATLPMYIVACFASVIGLLFCIFGFIWCKGKRKPTGTATLQEVEDPVCNNEPPPYEEGGNHIGIPLLESPVRQQVQVTSKNETESTFSLQVQGRSEQSLSQANPFKPAQEPYDTNQFSYEDDQELTTDQNGIEGQHSPNAPDLNDEETMPSNWTYHSDTPSGTTDNAVAAGDLDDSGVSMPSSNSTSTGSLADPLMLLGDTDRTLFMTLSFAGRIAPPPAELAASKRQHSPEREKKEEIVKRVRGNSVDSEGEEYQPDASEDDDRVMV